MSKNESLSNRSRRSFLKNSVAGLAGAAVLPGILSGEQTAPTTPTTPAEPAKKYKLVHRTLGKTGLKIPVISMGVMNADNPNLVKAALDSGITLLDTAWIYQRGKNEEMIGGVIKEKKRDSFYIATKVWEPTDQQTRLYPPDAKAETFLEKFETSLKRLGTDYVDILYLHNVARKESALFEPYIEAMKKLKKEGKIRFIGVSTHSNEPEVIRTAADSNLYEVVLTSYNFRQTNLKEVEAAIEYAAKKGLGIVAMKTQAGVYWDGKDKKFPIDMKAALKWALQNPYIHTAIPGFTTFDQLELDMSVMADLKLTAQEKETLNPPKEIKTVAGLYCQQCENCKRECPEKMDIPTMMRSYMYAYGYKNMSLAQQTLETVNIPENVCGSCSSCRVNCTMSFNLKDRIQDITRIKNVPSDFLV